MNSTDTLADRLAITDLVYRLGVCLDEGRYDDLGALVLEDATVRTPGGQAVGRDHLVAQARRNHPADQRFQHVITNVLIDLDSDGDGDGDGDGDRAAVRANLVIHVTIPDGTPPTRERPAPAPRASIGEIYRFGVVRTPTGWRFSRVETEALWLVGSLPPLPTT
jgi:hypothetical protein